MPITLKDLSQGDIICMRSTETLTEGEIRHYQMPPGPLYREVQRWYQILFIGKDRLNVTPPTHAFSTSLEFPHDLSKIEIVPKSKYLSFHVDRKAGKILPESVIF